MSDKNVTINLQVAGVAEVGRAFKSVEKTVADAEKKMSGVHNSESKKRAQATSESVTKILREMKRIAQTDDILKWNKNWKYGLDQAVRSTEVAVSKMKAAMSTLAGPAAYGFGKAIGQKNFNRATNIASHALTATAVGGGYLIADQARKFMSEEASAIALTRSMTTPEALKERGGRQFDPRAMMAFAGQVRAHTGMDKSEFLQASQSYIAKSSDWKMLETEQGKKDMMQLAEISVGTNTAMGDIMNAAGMLKVNNPTIDSQGMLSLMRNIVGQGKMGAVEISDLAKYASKISASSVQYGDGKGGYKNQEHAQGALLGWAQVAIQTVGTTAEASTSVANMSNEMGRNRDKIKKISGVDVTDGKSKKMRRLSDIWGEIFESVDGDVTKMGVGKGNMGFGERSIKIPKALMPYYDNAKKSKALELASSGLSVAEIEKQSRAAGSEAVRKQGRRFEDAGYSENEVALDFKAVMSGTGKRLDMAFATLQDSVMKGIAPTVESLGKGLAKSEQSINTFSGIVGNAAQTIVEHPIATALTALSFKFGAAGSAIGGFIVTLGLIEAWLNKESGNDAAARTSNNNMSLTVGDMTAKMRERISRGEAMTPAEMAEAQKFIASQTADLQAQKDHTGKYEYTLGASLASGASALVGHAVNVGEVLTGQLPSKNDYEAQKEERYKANLEANTKAMQDLVGVMKLVAVKTPDPKTEEPGPKGGARDKPIPPSGRK